MKDRSKEMLKNPMCISFFDGHSSYDKKDDKKSPNKKQQHTDIIELFELKRHVNFFDRKNLVSMMSNCDDKESLIKGINDILNDDSIEYRLRYYIMEVFSSSFLSHKYWKEMVGLLDYSFMGSYVLECDDRCLLNVGYYFKGCLIQAFINDIRRIDSVVFPDGNVSKVKYKMSDGRSFDLYVEIDHFGSLVEVDITKVKIKEVIMRNDSNQVKLNSVFIEDSLKKSFDDIQKFYAKNYIIDKTPIVDALYFRVNSDEHKYFICEKSFLRMIENTQAFYRIKALDKGRDDCEMMFCLSEVQPILFIDRFYSYTYDELLSKIYEEEKKMFIDDIDIYVTKPTKHKNRNMYYSNVVHVANRYVKYEKIPIFYKGFDKKVW